MNSQLSSVVPLRRRNRWSTNSRSSPEDTSGAHGGSGALAHHPLPEPAPPPRQDARPHGWLRREEGEHVL
nr:unnamed protein product [Digitaria exilis]